MESLLEELRGLDETIVVECHYDRIVFHTIGKAEILFTSDENLFIEFGSVLELNDLAIVHKLADIIIEYKGLFKRLFVY